MAGLTYDDLTDEQLKALVRGIHNTWHVISADVTCRNIEEQIEVTLDADYLVMYGHLTKELLATFDSLSFEEQDKVARYAFLGRPV